MPTQERRALIDSLEAKLGARVLVLVNGDRQGMETRIAPDILSLVSEHLASIGQNDALALFLYTPGGDSIVGWGLVHLLRQYCKRLSVVVPFRALSCGTLIALGADEIIMGRHGLLSPVDPSVSSPFNPPAPGVQQPGMVSLLPVSVEDMVGFLDLARREVGLKSEESLAAVLRLLTEKIHPLALGAVYRAREQSASLAKRLLKIHSHDARRIERITARLTRELPTHNYLIGRAEAREISLNVIEPSDETDSLMWRLYKEYEQWLKLTSPFSADLDLGTETRVRARYERAVIESIFDHALKQHIYATENDIVRIPGTPEQTVMRTVFTGWVSAKDGEVLS